MNRLARESSPYLLQHKDNPVDWYPWGEEAFARAKSEDKPILLSIGYSACHWCHVMEYESFENVEIARLMNDHFINIKVDREERPDLDQIYQKVAQAMTRSGGWPLTVFLTPDFKPFFGGTYFPPEDRYGRPGFPRVLLALSDAYRGDRESVIENARRLTDAIQAMESHPKCAPKVFSLEDLKAPFEDLLSRIDWTFGGLIGAPKFPNPMILGFLWRMGSATNNDQAKEAVLLSLQKMAEGGIYDQLGGGFHRYSVDESWSVPHFEKMLYDNALLLGLYSEVLLSGTRITSERKDLFLQVIEETVDYLLREMRAPEGAFFSAQDADSEGKEGRYFVWSPEELKAILTPNEAEAFSRFYGVTEEGNFEERRTVLFRACSGERSKWDPSLRPARGKVLEAREKRVHPATDDKILVSWNGLVITGLSWSSRALRELGKADMAERALDSAKRAFDFLETSVTRPDGRLYSVFRSEVAKNNAYLDDYAFLAQASLDLARSSTDDAETDRYIARAEEWVRSIINYFGDSSGSGYFFTSDDHERLIQRPKTFFDQAIPSGVAVALGCMAALAEIDRKRSGGFFLSEFERQLELLFPLAEKTPYGSGALLSTALLRTLGPIVVSGPGAENLCTHPHIFQKPSIAGQGASVLVCHRRSCGLPRSAWQLAKSEIEGKLSGSS